MLRINSLKKASLFICGVIWVSASNSACAYPYNNCIWRERGTQTYTDIENIFTTSAGNQSSNTPLFNRNSDLMFTATEGNNEVRGGEYWGVYANNIISRDYDDGTIVYYNTEPGYIDKPAVRLNAAKSNIISATGTPLFTIGSYNGSTIELTANLNNEASGSYTVVYASGNNAQGSARAILTAEQDNILKANEVYSQYGANCVSANNSASIQITSKKGDNTFQTTGTTLISYGIDAYNSGSVQIKALAGSNTVMHPHIGIHSYTNSSIDISAYKDNIITATLPSNTFSIFALNGGAVNITAETGSNILSADYNVYGKKRSKINLSAPQGTNEIKGGNVGVATASGSTADINNCSVITAGTALQAEGIDEDDQGNPVGDAAQINVNYSGDSSVSGNIYAYNQGIVNVTPADDSGTENITGLIAATGQNPSIDSTTGEEIDADPDTYVGGTINIDLNDGSTFTGYALTALDLGTDHDTTREGIINLNLAGNAFWYMTDSSSVTTLSGTGTVHYKDGGTALQIMNLSGSHTFEMDLSTTGSNSDMLYVLSSTGDQQYLKIKNVTQLNNEMSAGSAVRFAVFGDGHDEFRDGTVAATIANGVYNDVLTIRTRDIASDPDNNETYNDAYNGSSSVNKPTSETVQSLYYSGDNPQNVYVVKSQTANEGSTTPSKARQLVWRYGTDLDTFTKREGQTVYITPDSNNEGYWFRAAHRKVGIDGVGTTSGNSFELGFSKLEKNETEEKQRWGLSARYGRQTGHWDNTYGGLKINDGYIGWYNTKEYYSSEEKQKELPEWKRDAHNYWDTFLKVHRLKTEYDVTDSATGIEYAGRFHNFMVNLSTEYGRKIPISRSWYWTPQAQIQLSLLEGYKYTDSQGLQTKADDSWSLIGRLGFDLVHLLDEESDAKIYLKASVLHEFLDGGNVVTSSSGSSNTWLLNKGDQSGTWAVVGFGLSTRIGKDDFIFLDAEQAFGNDFENTFNIRAGINLNF